MRRDKPPPQTLKSLLAEKFYTASASDESNETDSTGDIGYFQQPSRGRTSCRGRTQDHGSQKPIHNFQDQSQRPPAVSRNSQMKPCSSLFGAVGSGSNNRARPSNPRKSSQIPANPRLSSWDWWRRSGSNRRPSACKADALPTELRPR